jgi:hypothetical protein
MKAIGLILVVLALAGCAQSPYSHDPRAAKVGPAYLDYIAQYPRDRATEYYYPVFTLRGMTCCQDSVADIPGPLANPIDPLLTQLPDVPACVQKITGKGYPCLESVGMRVFTGAQ